MIFKILKLVSMVCIALTTTGCDSAPQTEMPNQSPALNEPPGIPEHWAQISLSKTVSGDNLKVTLKGKKKEFRDIVGQITDDLPKPVKFASDVDPSQTLEEFEFKMDNGSWKDLLSDIAERFNCVVEESATEFLVTPGKSS